MDLRRTGIRATAFAGWVVAAACSSSVDSAHAAANCGLPVALEATALIADRRTADVRLGAAPKVGGPPLPAAQFPSDTLTGLGGLAIDQQGNSYLVTGKSQVTVLDKDCNVLDVLNFFPQFGSVTAVDVGPAGHVFTTFLGTAGAGVAVYPPVVSPAGPTAQPSLVIERQPITFIFLGALAFPRAARIIFALLVTLVMIADFADDSIQLFSFEGAGTLARAAPSAITITPIRQIKGPNTRIDGPEAVWSDGQHLWVADREGAGSIKRFPIGASGDVPPDLVLLHPVGSPHRIVFPQGLQGDPIRNELWVADARPSVKVYRLDTPGGDDPPLRTIGAAAGLAFPRDLALPVTPPL